MIDPALFKNYRKYEETGELVKLSAQVNALHVDLRQDGSKNLVARQGDITLHFSLDDEAVNALVDMLRNSRTAP